MLSLVFHIMTTSECGVTTQPSKCICIQMMTLLACYVHIMITNNHLLFVFIFRWWPEIPVILAIIAATGIMGTLCHHVYKIETQTTQYTSIGASLSMKVFKQSCWFVIAFYITWVPYLTLQVNMEKTWLTMLAFCTGAVWTQQTQKNFSLAQM